MKVKTKNKILSGFIASTCSVALLAGSFIGVQAIAQSDLNLVDTLDAEAAMSAGSGGGGGGGGSAAGLEWREIDVGTFLDRKPYADRIGIWNGIDPGVCVDPGARRFAKFVAGSNSVAFSEAAVGNVGIAPAVWHGTMNTPYVNVICGYDNVKIDEGYHYRVRLVSDSTDSISEQYPYSITTTVEPQIKVAGLSIDGKPNSKDPIGENNLHSQTSPALITAFGVIYDTIRADTQLDRDLVSRYKASVSQAITAYRAQARSEVTLDENNVAGMAEGGVLNVTENGVMARITLSTNTKSYQLQRAKWESWTNGTSYTEGWSNVDSAPGDAVYSSTPGQKNTTDSNSRNLWNANASSARNGAWNTYASTINTPEKTQAPLGFWQMLSVNCNADGVRALQSAYGTSLVEVSNSGDVKNAYTVLVRTPKYATMSAAPYILGTQSTSSTIPAGIRATGNLGFYDKECPFDCTPSRLVEDGASAENGAIDNVRSDGFNGTTSRGLYGNSATKDGVNSSYLEIFRDNNANNISPDVWYPKSENGVDYKSNPTGAKSTIISRWANGTPNDTKTSGASKLEDVFRATYNDGEQDRDLFTSATQGAYRAKNSSSPDDVSYYSSPTLGRAPGLIDNFNLQGAWTSSNGAPQVLNIKWEYRTNVQKGVLNGSLGMSPLSGSGGNTVQGTLTTVITQLDGICVGEFGTDTNTSRASIITEVGSNTGTGSTTSWTVRNTTGDQRLASENLVAKFIRATAE